MVELLRSRAWFVYSESRASHTVKSTIFGQGFCTFCLRSSDSGEPHYHHVWLVDSGEAILVCFGMILPSFLVHLSFAQPELGTPKSPGSSHYGGDSAGPQPSLVGLVLRQIFFYLPPCIDSDTDPYDCRLPSFLPPVFFSPRTTARSNLKRVVCSANTEWAGCLPWKISA